jgi:endonuclease-3 related protein
MSAAAICSIGQDELAEVIRSCGYFNLKAKRLQAFCGWYNGREQALSALETVPLREALLAVHGVGPETADDMLLYAFQRPVFVIDTYTRRLFERLGWYPQKSPYQQLQQFVEGAFSSWKEAERIVIFNELHGLIVAHAKAFCKKQPRCMGCPLQCGYEPEKK